MKRNWEDNDALSVNNDLWLIIHEKSGPDFQLIMDGIVATASPTFMSIGRAYFSLPPSDEEKAKQKSRIHPIGIMLYNPMDGGWKIRESGHEDLVETVRQLIDELLKQSKDLRKRWAKEKMEALEKERGREDEALNQSVSKWRADKQITNPDGATL